MKIMIVFGTRPEVIKLAPLIIELKSRRSSNVEVCVCSSGQHREMAAQALSVFRLIPDIDLDIMQPGQTLSDLSSRLMTAISSAIDDERPDVIVVQGDTTTAFITGLAAFYKRVPVAHVEAGLRTGDLSSPFPEELNRVLLSKIARWHFAPTKSSADVLKNEGVNQAHITVSGNTVVDAIEIIRAKWSEKQPSFKFNCELIPAQCVLVTTHRRENFGDGLRNILTAVNQLSIEFPSFKFIIPVHLNPNVQEEVHLALSNKPNIILLGPVTFEESLYLQSMSRLILTDSGGIQEEAPSFGIPVVVLREHTERREGIDAGFSVLAGTNTETILEYSRNYLDESSSGLDFFKKLKSEKNPYGDGNAAGIIADTILGEWRCK